MLSRNETCESRATPSSRAKVRGKKVPRHLVGYFKNAPLRRLRHPLEENILTSLLITLVAVGVAVVFGVPVLCFVGVLLFLAVFLRYLLLVLAGLANYLHFVTCNRNVPTRSTPQIFPRERLAFANDIRWLGDRGPKKCQSILHTVLVFEGAMDLHNLRHLVHTRVLQAETPDGGLAYPRLLQKLIPLVSGFSWELDHQFDIQNHIFAGPSHISTEKQVQEYISLLLIESLPLGKPLWEIRVLPNYGTQKDTLAVLRVHQCLADGMTLVRILSHSLSDQQQMHIPQRPHFAGLSFGFNMIRSLIVGPLTLLLWLIGSLRDRNYFTRPFTPKKSGKGRAYSKRRANNPEDPPIDHRRENKRSNLGNERGKFIPGTSASSWEVVWSAAMTVPALTRIKQIMRSSFNDVLLAALSGSVRNYLKSKGVPYPDDIKVVIPVDLRNDIASPKSSTKLGCKVASVLTTVPSGTESAIPRLWATRHRLDELKASADPVVAYGVASILMSVLPHKLGVWTLEKITNKASLQFCNLPGPGSTLVIGGVPLKGVYPIYPPPGNVRAALSVFTYADQVYLTVVAHRSLHNAGQEIISGMLDQVDQLSRQLSQRRVPGETRRSTRNVSTANTEITKPPTRQIHLQLQVVQEELQHLSNKLDSNNGTCEGYFLSSQESIAMSLGEESDGHTELRTRFKSLKNEFTELIGELRRRSSIVEGIALSFEDEEMEEEFRKPRKRALSVVSLSVSNRRSSMFGGTNRSVTTPESSQIYSSDEDVSSSTTPPLQATDVQTYSGQNLRSSASPIRTTAV